MAIQLIVQRAGHHFLPQHSIFTTNQPCTCKHLYAAFSTAKKPDYHSVVHFLGSCRVINHFAAQSESSLLHLWFRHSAHGSVLVGAENVIRVTLGCVVFMLACPEYNNIVLSSGRGLVKMYPEKSANSCSMLPTHIYSIPRQHWC